MPYRLKRLNQQRLLRLNPGSQAARARLLGRQWYFGIVTSSPTSATFPVSVPAGAKWVVARGVGSGGGRNSSVGTSTGGGAEYARVKAKVSSASSISVVVANSAEIGQNGVDSTVSLDGAVILRAKGGQAGQSGASGAGGTGGVGDILRPGSAGTSSVGGASGSDFDDPDSLWVGGWGKQTAAFTPATDGTEPSRLPAYGSGGADSGAGGPGAADGRAGEPGVVVLEFYDGDPG